MTEIIFIPTSSGGYYVNRSKAALTAHCGCGWIKFDLSAAEMSKLQESEPECSVWGDEADIVFPGVEPDWVEQIKSLPTLPEEQLPTDGREWFYWCEVDESGDIVESW